MQTNEAVKKEGQLEDITGITCLYVPVNNVFESVAWYLKNLGCEPAVFHPVLPGMKQAIMRFPEHDGNVWGPGIRQTVPALFLIEAGADVGRLGFTASSGERHAMGCFITPRIHELYNRFKENGVTLIGDLRERGGLNLQFADPDGNVWEVWQPE